jgi:hypothetical protein
LTVDNDDFLRICGRLFQPSIIRRQSNEVDDRSPSRLSIGRATAATPIHIDAPFPRIDFTASTPPVSFSGNVATTPNGIWLGGNIGKGPALVLLKSDASLSVFRYTDIDNAQAIGSLPTPPLGNAILATTADGGAFAITRYVGGFGQITCSISRYTPEAALIWNISACTSVPALGVDGTGALWIVDTSGIIERISPDGSHVDQIEVDDPVDQHSAFVGNPKGDGLYRAKGVPASIELIDRIGQSHPVWSALATSTSIDHLFVGSDANLYATGAVGNLLTSFSITPQGQLRWSFTGGGSGATTMGAALFSDNAMGVVQDDGSIAKVSSTGTLRFATLSTSFSYCDEQVVTGVYRSDCNVTTAGSDLVVTFVDKDSDPVVERYSDAGAVLATTKFNRIGGYLSDIDALADDSAIATILSDSLGTPTVELARLGRTGQAIALPNLTNILDDNSGLLASKHLSDGTDYLLTAGTTQHAVSHIGSDGAVLWTTMLSTTESFELATMDTSSDRVCINHSAEIVCLAATDGHVLYSINRQLLRTWRVLDDGSVAIVYRGPDDTTPPEYVIVDPNGTIGPDILLSGPSVNANFAINGSGMLVAADLSMSRKVYGYDRHGAALYSHASPHDDEFPQDIATFVSPDGTAILVSYFGISDANNAPRDTLWTISPTGVNVWLKDFDPNYSFSDLQIRGEKAFASLWNYDDRNTIVQEFSIADGTGAWQRDLNGAYLNDDCKFFVFGDDLTASSDSPLLLTCIGTFQFHAVMLDSSNGSVVGDLRQNCGAGRCGIESSGVESTAALLPGNQLRIAVNVRDAYTGTRAYVYSIAHATDVPPAISLTQSGIDGAWYAPYKSGQGFIFDYIAGNGTLFIPWFTYSVVQMTNPSDLAWYSLQGTLSAGETSADLTIYVTAPGIFDTGAVAGHAVGSAHLSLSDCNNGIVIYQFDAGINGGAGGTIALSRLTPSTGACVLASSGAAPAQNTNAPAAGFDAHQSGSWYDPNKSGQGVEMTIVPSGNGYAGLAFAAWFTFDPAGKSDDPINQHWFTLQGDLSTAASGKVTLPILRVIGGSLDGLPTRNSSQVGHATLSMQGCDKAQLDYQFDSSDVAHSFAGLAGHIDLVKIGGCASP